MGLVTDSFGPVAVTDRRMLVPMPAGWSFAQAAAVPVVYLTAYYGLVDLAGLRAGERRAGARRRRRRRDGGGAARPAPGRGGVRDSQPGQVGRRAGRWASPPSGSPRSRDLGFRDQFLEATGGQGVDVVLDALAGEFVDASLDLLPRGGRFIEMGKADIRDPQVVAREHPGCVTAPSTCSRPGRTGSRRCCARSSRCSSSGALRACADPDVGRAPRCGGVPASCGRAATPARSCSPSRRRWTRTGTVLITGGTGGLGALLARHLARPHGAAPPAAGQPAGPGRAGARRNWSAELDGLGCQARVAACDVADRDQLAALLRIAGAPADRRGARGRGAGRRRWCESLTPEQIDRVMRPKVDAALLLHELTAGMDLAAFVLFSSVAALIGSPGQANYCRGQRRPGRAGRSAAAPRACPACSLAWGLWAERPGMTGDLERAPTWPGWPASGLGALQAELGLELFDQAQRLDAALLVPVRLDLAALRAQASAGQLPPLLRGLVRRLPGTPATGGVAGRSGWPRCRSRTGAASALDLVQAQAAAVLGHASRGRGRAGPGVQGTRIRLAGRGRTAQPAHPGHRAAAARHPGLRPPDPGALAQYLILLAMPDAVADIGSPSEEDNDPGRAGLDPGRPPAQGRAA